MSFSKRLKSLRKNHHLNQTQLGEIVGVTVKQIQRYERAENEPTMSVLIALSNYFDIPVDFLLERGIYKNWEEIMEHRELILKIIEVSLPEISSAFKLSSRTETELMHIFPAFIDHIDFIYESESIHPNIYFHT